MNSAQTPMGITVTLMVASALIGAGINQDVIPKSLLLGLGSLFFLVALIAWQQRTQTRRRVRTRARHILRELIAEGDRLYHRGGPSEVEEWRSIIGNKLNASPFRRGTGDWVLTQHEGRHLDPLERLRQIEGELENWIVEDSE
jgi:hypothetical protein